MVPNVQMLFGNFFDDKNITPTRLLNFSNDSLNKFTKANTGGQFDDIIGIIKPLINTLGLSLGDVDTSVNIQKGTTLTNDEVIHSFSATMSEQEPFIASDLGGRNTPAYLQFYPHKISEYTNATKESMPTLTKRINTAATANATALGLTLTPLLQGFQLAWTNSRDSQQQQMGDVKSNQSDRGTTVTDVQIGMVTAVHTVAAMFPGNVLQCSAFFNFTLLFTEAHHKHQTFDGTPAAGQTVQVFDRTLTDSIGITIRNLSTNSAIAVWLSLTGTGSAPDTAIIIQPGGSISLKAHELGDLINTFFMIANISTVNAGNYEVEIVG
jgi:hypothetical protein